jgi:hypothetical protein
MRTEKQTDMTTLQPVAFRNFANHSKWMLQRSQKKKKKKKKTPRCCRDTAYSRRNAAPNGPTARMNAYGPLVDGIWQRESEALRDKPSRCQPIQHQSPHALTPGFHGEKIVANVRFLISRKGNCTMGPTENYIGLSALTSSTKFHRIP